MGVLSIISLSLAFSLGFLALMAYVVLRPGGLVEGVITHRLESGTSTQGSIDEIWLQLKKLKMDIESVRQEAGTIDAMAGTQIKALSNRLTSFETKWGKMDKRERDDVLRREIEQRIANGEQIIT